MFHSRGKMGGAQRVTGENAEALALRAKLIQQHGAAKARKHPDWPSLKQGKAKPKAKTKNGQGIPTEERKAQIAEMVAEGMTQKQIAAELSLSISYVERLWKAIREEMGWQAV